MTRLGELAGLVIMLISAFCLGYQSRRVTAPRPEFVIDVYPGDVSLDRLIAEGKVHTSFKCPEGYTLIAADESEPRCER